MRSPSILLIILCAWLGATAAASEQQYGGALTMACGKEVVSLDLAFSDADRVTGTARVGGSAQQVAGRLQHVGGKTACVLDITPGLLVGGSAVAQTSFTFPDVKLSNTGKKDKPKRLSGREKNGVLTLDIRGG